MTYLQSRCKSTVYFLEHIHSLICISLSELTNCLLFETLVRLSSKHESCFRFAYWKMVIFTKLLNSITWEQPLCFSVYATTAANPHESSYACYYDEKRETYLGDWYSVIWMEDSDAVGVPYWNYLQYVAIQSSQSG